MSTTPTLAPPHQQTTARIVGAFRVVAVVEAFTWAGLLVGMYLKYVPGTTEAGVHLFGPLHGAAFLCYGVLALLVAYRLRWPVRWTTLLALAAAVPPFATAVFEVWAQRSGRLRADTVDRS